MKNRGTINFWTGGKSGSYGISFVSAKGARGSSHHAHESNESNESNDCRAPITYTSLQCAAFKSSLRDAMLMQCNTKMSESLVAFTACAPVLQEAVAAAFHSQWAAELEVADANACLAKLHTTFDDKPNSLFVLANSTLLATVTIDMKSITGCSPMIGNVYTSPTLRRQGHATRMLAFAETHLRHCGFLVAYLWCYEDLEAFYKARGWYKIQDHSVTNKPAVIMVKNLS